MTKKSLTEVLGAAEFLSDPQAQGNCQRPEVGGDSSNYGEGYVVQPAFHVRGV